MKPTHGYLTEPEWFARNAPEEEASNWPVYLAIALIVAFCVFMMVPF